MTTTQIILVAAIALIALIALYTTYKRRKYMRMLDKEAADNMAQIESERQMYAAMDRIKNQSAYEASLPEQDLVEPDVLARYEKSVDDLCKYEAENTNSGTGDEWDFETPKPGKTEEL